jgi:hypothetical protein
MTAPATYVYCLVQAAGRPMLQDAPSGLPHTGAVRAVATGTGLWLVVADAPEEHYAGDCIDRGLTDLEWVSECAVAHERVVESALALGDVLPLKLFTLFESDRRAREAMAERRAEIGDLFGRTAGCLEWSARIDAMPGLAKAAEPKTDDDRARRSGAAYLESKRQAIAGRRERAQQVRASADAAFKALAGHAADRRRQPRPEARGSLLAEEVFLVPREREREFQRCAEEQLEALAGTGLRLTLSGPWPVYHFVEWRG